MEVEMDASGVVHHHHHHHQQEMSSQTLEGMLVCTKAQAEKKPRPPEQALKCPRCDSTNTKFCYYNNYSLTQPRYFCKSCRRYWTKGGTLRNVPVGGGCRKNKRSSSSSSSSATSSNSSSSAAVLSKIRDHHHHPLTLASTNNPLLSGLPHLPYADSTCTDLSLAFARLQSQANGQMGFDHFDHTTPAGDQQYNGGGFLDAIRGGFLDHNGFHNVMYNGGNMGNGDLGGTSVENGGGNGMLMGLTSSGDHDQEIMINPIFHDQDLINGVPSCAATTAVTMTTVKQETCNGRSEVVENRGGPAGVLWGFPWQMGAGSADQPNLVHEVDSVRSQIGGWNGLGSTTWHGLLNSPLM